MIAEWLAKRMKRADEDLRIRGFNYAAGQLLTDPTEETVQRLLNEAYCDDFNKFDFGMIQAVNAFERLLKETQAKV